MLAVIEKLRFFLFDAEEPTFLITLVNKENRDYFMFMDFILGGSFTFLLPSNPSDCFICIRIRPTFLYEIYYVVRPKKTF